MSLDFLAIRKIPLVEREPFQQDGSSAKFGGNESEDPQVASTIAEIRKTLLTDRALHDKAAKAFVSFVRAYSKHEASYIFRIKGLDLVGVAKSFGLLRLPRMPELDQIDRTSWEDADLNWHGYAYADQVQETKRLAEAEKKDASAAVINKRRGDRAEKRKANAAWSNKSAREDERLKRKEKKGRKNTWLEAQQGASSEAQGAMGVLGAQELEGAEGDEDEWGELAREERMAKKVKRGHLSQGLFDAEFTGL